MELIPNKDSNNSDLAKQKSEKAVQSFKHFPKESYLCSTVLVSCNFYYDHKNKTIRCTECLFAEQNIMINTITQICINHANFSTNRCQNLQYQIEFLQEIKHDNLDIFNYHSESQRLQTFENVHLELQPKELANNGLYIRQDYYPLNERFHGLKCAYCPFECIIFSKSLLNNRYENPLCDHLRMYPQCPISKYFSNKKEICQRDTINLKCRNMKQLKIILMRLLKLTNGRPYHHGFTSEQDRFESFVGWPTYITQRPIALAKAGFFYFGTDDMVKCHYCNIAFSQWEPSDVPLIEHARFSPNCGFIRLLIGNDFKYVLQDNCSYNDLENDVFARLDCNNVRMLISVVGLNEKTISLVIEAKLVLNQYNTDNLFELTRDCMEFEEVFAMIKRLIKDLKHVDNVQNCIKCSKQPVNSICFPCMHHTTCFECIYSMHKCLTCDEPLEAHIRFS